MSNENKQPAAVRVCAISDVECSRGCGTGACKKEAAHDHIADARKLVAQPDERAAFADLAHEVWSAAQLPPGEGIADGVARIEAILARATQQATKGDEICEHEWSPITEPHKECDKCGEVRRDWDAVAGSAGQAPIYQVRDDVRTWIDVDADMFERSQQEDRRIVYATPSLPQGIVRHPVATTEWCMKMAALEPEEGVPPAGLAALDNSTTAIPVSPDELAKLSAAPSLTTDAQKRQRADLDDCILDAIRRLSATHTNTEIREFFAIQEQRAAAQEQARHA